MDNVIKAHREEVGKKIRDARISAGLSHDRLAMQTGTSRQHLIKLEKGQHLARPELLDRISAATGKSIDWFRPEPGQDRATSASEAA